LLPAAKKKSPRRLQSCAAKFPRRQLNMRSSTKSQAAKRKKIRPRDVDAGNPRNKLVYMLLANHAEGNANGQCWPSIKTLSRETGLCRNTVKSARADLVSRGLISYEHRLRSNRSSESTCYTVLLLAPGVKAIDPSPVKAIDPPYEDSIEDSREEAPLSAPAGAPETAPPAPGPLNHNWKPLPDDRAFARKTRGYTDADIDGWLVPGFIDHYTSENKGAVAADWSVRWRKWVRFEKRLPASKVRARNVTPLRPGGANWTERKDSVWVGPGTAKWNTWRAHYVDQGCTVLLKEMDKAAHENKQFIVPSDWPPGHQIAQAA
jgi:hypothetical protein